MRTMSSRLAGLRPAARPLRQLASRSTGRRPPAADRARRSAGDIVVVQHAQRGAIEVLVLTGPQRPQEREQADEAKTERHGDEKDEGVHEAARVAGAEPGPCGASSARRRRLRRRRSALAVTSRDEPDIASAAIRGVTRPATAMGMAMRL